jgi:homogentisate 1,2-dioxygenase
MGLIEGVYDAKAEGFLPGGASLHNCMSGHGPDAATVERASAADTTRPEFVSSTMAFMFETRRILQPTAAATALPQVQSDYARCWQGLPKRFTAHSR